MFYALHVPINVYPISLVQTRLRSASVRKTRDFGIRALGIQKEDIRPRVICYSVDMAKYIRSNIVRCAVNDEIGIDVNNCGPLIKVSALMWKFAIIAVPGK